ncbi:CLUMA_CG021630, isoform A [Clunio marinus]|uniref:CLUMA_CG021630, isoform A n=1 Tax=Clunio marinus TaxID=568069 RepID=A0A1J1J9Z3_9DIPT|nr:CLUMA_CG021630, isoform A [Clunio marinus]
MHSFECLYVCLFGVKLRIYFVNALVNYFHVRAKSKTEMTYLMYVYVAITNLRTGICNSNKNEAYDLNKTRLEQG